VPRGAKRDQSARSEVAIVYARVSATDAQSDSDLSLENQKDVLSAAAMAAGFKEIEVVSERHTASKAQPELEKALHRLALGEASALYALKIDRLSRKGAKDVLRIADLAEEQGWRLVVSDVALDTGTTVGRLVLTILSGVAEMESRRRSERMVEYHAARRARGERSGVDYGMKPSVTRSVISKIKRARKAGKTWQEIADLLNAHGADGRRWYPASVRRVYLQAA
jgi:DNA invertase Pin-like site-specific DNA recombinase